MLNTDVMNAIKQKFKEYEKAFSLDIHIFVLTKTILKFSDISVIEYICFNLSLTLCNMLI